MENQEKEGRIVMLNKNTGLISQNGEHRRRRKLLTRPETLQSPTFDHSKVMMSLI